VDVGVGVGRGSSSTACAGTRRLQDRRIPMKHQSQAFLPTLCQSQAHSQVRGKVLTQGNQPEKCRTVLSPACAPAPAEGAAPAGRLSRAST